MKFKWIFLIITQLFLISCVAAVMAGATAGMVVYDKRSVVTIESDARIFHLVHNAIAKDNRFHDSRILVSSFNNVVLLVGQTPAASLRVLAEKIAQNTPKVRRVYNEVTLEYPIAYSERTKDTWITSQVKSMMLTRKGLASGSIRVVSENSVVFLMGVVTQQQANLAVDVARQVDGVNKVVKVFQYIG